MSCVEVTSNLDRMRDSSVGGAWMGVDVDWAETETSSNEAAASEKPAREKQRRRDGIEVMKGEGDAALEHQLSHKYTLLCR